MTARWDALFADLEAQAAEQARSDRDAEVDELWRAESARHTLTDRLRAALGSTVTLRGDGSLAVTGRLQHAGPDWLLVSEGAGREALVATAAVHTVAGVGRWTAAPAGSLESRLGLRHVLRGVARDRSAVRLQLRDGSQLDGTLDRVGADFVELAAHPAGEPRRRGSVRERLIVATGSIAAVRRDE